VSTAVPWLENLLTRLASTGEAGEAAFRYIRERQVPVRIRKQATGARWTLFGAIELNPDYVGAISDNYAMSLIVHEVHHLKQGWQLALSVEGELEAWQVQFAYLKTVMGMFFPVPEYDAVIAELMSLPSTRAGLIRARTLMQKFAGKKYRVDLLPLYPLWKEILFRAGLQE
jgi:hypothetical protein